MLREIIFDTETTGVDPANGDRVVEIGCVELINHVPTGETFHRYLNPERAMPAGAFAVHGLSEAFLADKPLFADVAEEFLAFIGEARLIAHNASFDIGFLNMELARLSLGPLAQARVVDTLSLARRKHPGASNSLDALCQRYGIDSARRTKHGALLDAELLAEVYIELIGGKQTALSLTPVTAARPSEGSAADLAPLAPLARPVPLASRLSAEGLAAHEAFVGRMPNGGLWALYKETPAE